MGGDHGHGPVLQEADEPLFHHEWEAKVMSLALAAGTCGHWNIDMSRFAREDTPPGDYLARSYYEMWLYGLEKLVVERGLITEDELAAAGEGAVAPMTEPCLAAENVESAMRRGASARVVAEVPPQFSVGDEVVVHVATPRGHTRAPRYVRGKTGVVTSDHGVFAFADTNAHDMGTKPQHVYSVRFEADVLWGPDSEGGAVYVDLWDDHLESV